MKWWHPFVVANFLLLLTAGLLEASPAPAYWVPVGSGDGQGGWQFCECWVKPMGGMICICVVSSN